MSIQSNSIITQVSQNTGGVGVGGYNIYDENENDAYENIQLNLRGVLFNISREELLRLPESILIGITNGALYDPNANNDGSTQNPNTLSPDCFQYTLDVFRAASKGLPPTLLSIEEDFGDGEYNDGMNEIQGETIQGVDIDDKEDEAQAVPQSAAADQPSPHPVTETVSDISEILRRRPAIIVLREDLDYYCLPTSTSLNPEAMRKLKHNCGDAILNQKLIFNGLRKGKTENSPEHHLISMLCSSGFKIEDEWGFRAREPHTTVISSLALIRLQPEDNDNEEQQPTSDPQQQQHQQELSTPQKLLLFWRKPARKCWWDSVELDIPGIDNPIRVHIRRVWTLELSVIGVR